MFISFHCLFLYILTLCMYIPILEVLKNTAFQIISSMLYKFVFQPLSSFAFFNLNIVFTLIYSIFEIGLTCLMYQIISLALLPDQLYLPHLSICFLFFLALAGFSTGNYDPFLIPLYLQVCPQVLSLVPLLLHSLASYS